MLTPDIIAKLGARFFQYSLEATLPSTDGSYQALPAEQIQAGFHFWSEVLTIEYTTLITSEEAETDDGVCPFAGTFKSGSNQIPLSNSAIKLSTIATPGRQRALGVSGDPSLPLHIQGFPWTYFYEATGSIIVDLRMANRGGSFNTVRFVWTGYLIPIGSCPNAQAFYSLLASIPCFARTRIHWDAREENSPCNARARGPGRSSSRARSFPIGKYSAAPRSRRPP